MGFQEGTDEKRWFLKVFLGSQVGAGGSQVRVLRKTSQRTAGWPRLVPHEAVGLCMPTAQGCYESWIMCAKHAAYFQASGENCQGVCAGVTAVLTVTASAVTGAVYQSGSGSAPCPTAAWHQQDRGGASKLDGYL